MQYVITPDMSIEVDEKGQMSIRDLSRLMLVLADHKLVMAQEGFDLFASVGKPEEQLVVVYDANIDADALVEEHNAILYSPLADASLAQMLMRKFNINLSSIITVNGNLNPKWKAERLGPFMALSEQYNALLAPTEEPLSIVNDNPNMAIGLCAALAIGVGRTTFVSFDAAGNAKLIYMSHENVPTLFAKGFGKTIFPASQLDEYIACGAPESLLNEAITKARQEYEAAKSEGKDTIEDAVTEPVAEKDAVAAGGGAPEAGVKAEQEVVEPTPAVEDNKQEPAIVESVQEQPVVQPTVQNEQRVEEIVPVQAEQAPQPAESDPAPAPVVEPTPAPVVEPAPAVVDSATPAVDAQ